jgi:hypothetical protein
MDWPRAHRAGVSTAQVIVSWSAPWPSIATWMAAISWPPAMRVRNSHEISSRRHLMPIAGNPFVGPGRHVRPARSRDPARLDLAPLTAEDVGMASNRRRPGEEAD